ncbi:unnamed protein product [Cylicocyclus nassatus]|uniref:Major facilitator superfamily (MFS) profile domain-containing protein n=1 Tax=Cylicocyclus nassatus TaxID=53992 RepID=A0AA36DK40_CYLNA|nr:unnamed protein product [Cylicocyclus nassatus]
MLVGHLLKADDAQPTSSKKIWAIVVVPILSSLADRYGRRPLVLLSLTLSFVCHILASFAPNYLMFVSLRFIIGASSDTFYSLCTVITCEMIPSASRAWITLIATIGL